MNEATIQPGTQAQEARRLYGLLAEFEDVLSLLQAAEKVRDAGYRHWDTYTPIPIHGLDEAMGIRRTVLPWVVFAAGFTGALAAFFLQWWMNGLNYPYVVSGKPLLGIPAFVPIIFEVTVLFSAITALVAMLAFNGLPRLYHAWFNSRAFAARVTTDRFFIGIEARDAKFDLEATGRLLWEAGALNVETIEEATGPAALPGFVRRYAVPAGVVLAAVALVPPILIARARVMHSANTRVQVMPDMDQQRKYLPQSANAIFADNRAMRPIVDGAVAAGRTQLDSPLERGIVNGQWVTDFPMPMTAAVLQRGLERFNIFCSPCHGWDGAGDGMVAVRGQATSPGTWVVPTNLHDATVRDRPNGHIFNTITNGIRTMPPYEAQIPVEDRWAIIAYVRALQLSQAAPVDAVPAERRGELR